MNYKPRIRKTCRRIFSRAFRFLDQPGEPGHKLQHFSFLLDRFNGCFYLHATIRLVRRWKHHQIWRLAKSLFERKVIVPNACSAEKPTLKKMKSFKLCPKLCFEYPLYVKLVIYICVPKNTTPFWEMEVFQIMGVPAVPCDFRIREFFTINWGSPMTERPTAHLVHHLDLGWPDHHWMNQEVTVGKFSAENKKVKNRRFRGFLETLCLRKLIHRHIKLLTAASCAFNEAVFLMPTVCVSVWGTFPSSSWSFGVF